MDRAKVKVGWDRFVGGDKEAFGYIYESYAPILTFFCLGKVKDLQVAENCSSEALMKTLDHDDPGKIRNLEHWLFTVAQNACISHLRKDNTRNRILENSSEIFSKNQLPQIDLAYDEEGLERTISSELNEHEHRLWQLHAEGYDNLEIAEKLEMNEKSVANRKSEIRLRLKAAVKNYINSWELKTGKTS